MSNSTQNITVNRKTKTFVAITVAFLFMSLVTFIWVDVMIERDTNKAAIEKTQNIATNLLDSLNIMMQGKIIQEKEIRKLLFFKYRSNNTIKELRVFRSDAVVKQFGAGMASESPIDKMDADVISKGKPIFQRNIREERLRGVIPFIARKSYKGQNCLSCHHVPEGTVNGATSITIDTNIIKAETAGKYHKFFYIIGISYLFFLIAFFYINRNDFSFPQKVRRAVINGEKQYVDIKKMNDEESVLLFDINNLIDVAEKEDEEIDNLKWNKLTSEQREAGNIIELLETVKKQQDELTSISAAADEIYESNKETFNYINLSHKNIKESKENMAKIESNSNTNNAVIEDTSELFTAMNEKQNELKGLIVRLDGIIAGVKNISYKSGLISITAEIESSEGKAGGADFTGIASQLQELADGMTKYNKEGHVIINSIHQSISKILAVGDELNEKLKQIEDMAKVNNEIISLNSDKLNDEYFVLDSMRDGSQQQTIAANDIAVRVSSIRDKHNETTSIIKKILTKTTVKND